MVYALRRSSCHARSTNEGAIWPENRYYHIFYIFICILDNTRIEQKSHGFAFIVVTCSHAAVRQ